MAKYSQVVLVCIGAIILCSLNYFNSTLLQSSKALPKYGYKSCIKPRAASSYKICDSLPYTSIKCGAGNSSWTTDSKTKMVVPNEAVFVWFGKDKTFMYYNYLALRSIASIQHPERIKFYYSLGLPVGQYWERSVREIPCLKLIRIKEPGEIFGVKMPDVVRRTDLARLNIIIDSGGIYLDGDVITLKNLDSLRIYPTTLGRSTKKCVCLCVIFASKDSLFLKEFRKKIPIHFDKYHPASFTTVFLRKFVEQTNAKINLEESSINRPNPHVSQDGILSTTMDNIDISDNYFLHIHPKRANSRIKPDVRWGLWDENTLRTLDSVYGEAARIALFGSPDLIFKPGENTFEMKAKKKIFQFQPLKKKNSVFK